MSILFIADIHLCNKNPNIVNGFLNFLKNQAVHAQALYILGDLFEIWLGDDDKNVLHTSIANGLSVLNKKKIPCYFIHGNHDFLLGSKYAKLCKMVLLPRIQVLKLPSGKNVVMLHGDTLCINDKSYQQFQKILQHYLFQTLFLSLPLSVRLFMFNIANICCMKHKQYKQKKQLYVDYKTIIDILTQNKSKIMIHGHTHQSTIHNIHYSKSIIFKRVVLGRWDDYGSVVEIDIKNDSCTLIKFPLDTT